eukprot:354565-Chlamydomonas_euryale.AAC.4
MAFRYKFSWREKDRCGRGCATQVFFFMVRSKRGGVGALPCKAFCPSSAYLELTQAVASLARPLHNCAHALLGTYAHMRVLCWAGGGEVDLKLGVPTEDFIRAYNPFIADITY